MPFAGMTSGWHDSPDYLMQRNGAVLRGLVDDVSCLPGVVDSDTDRRDVYRFMSGPNGMSWDVQRLSRLRWTQLMLAIRIGAVRELSSSRPISSSTLNRRLWGCLWNCFSRERGMFPSAVKTCG